MATKLTEVQHELLRKIAEDNDFKDYEMEEYSASGKGDNYLGKLLGITIKDNTKALELIVKLAPQNEDFRNVIRIRDIFLKEIQMYRGVLARFTKFQIENGVKNPFMSYAKCYGDCKTAPSECLIMENLVKKGYSLWNRKLPMRSEHISLVMLELGKFHAISFAMKKKNPELYSEVASHLKKIPTEFEKKSFNNFIQNSTATIQKAIQGHVELENAFKKMMPGIQQFFTVELKKNEDKMVITHGDTWCNNMLFKYEDPNDESKPTKMCLIDWQISRYAYPIIDLAYFFCASSSKQILDDYKKYQKVYYESFAQALRDMSCDPEEIFSFVEFEEMWKNCIKFGLFISCLVFKILLVDSDEAADTNNLKSANDFFKMFNVAGIEDKIRDRIVDVFSFMVENDFV